MTREEAIERLKTDIYEYADFTENPNENEFWMAFDVAIKALEQQTCEDAISRSEAIKALKDVTNLNGEPLFESLGLYPWNLLNELPSVNPAKKQEPCEDAVSREAVLGLFAQNADAVRPYSKTWEEVKALPSVNPQPNVGQWIYTGDYLTEGMLKCSECGEKIDVSESYYDFCPVCGAKMVEPQERSKE